MVIEILANSLILLCSVSAVVILTNVLILSWRNRK